MLSVTVPGSPMSGNHGAPPSLYSSYPATPTHAYSSAGPPGTPGGYDSVSFQPNFPPSGMTPYPQQAPQNQMPSGMTPYPQQPHQGQMPSGVTSYPQQTPQNHMTTGMTPYPQQASQNTMPSGMTPYPQQPPQNAPYAQPPSGMTPFPQQAPPNTMQMGMSAYAPQANQNSATQQMMQYPQQQHPFMQQTQYFSNPVPTSPHAAHNSHGAATYYQPNNMAPSVQTFPSEADSFSQQQMLALTNSSTSSRGNDFLESGEALLSHSEEVPQPAYGTCSLQGLRMSNEDRVFCFPRLDSSIPNVACFAVFDGHGGIHAADHCLEFIPHFLRAKIQEYGPNFNLSHVERLLTECFSQADRDYIRKASSMGFTPNDLTHLAESMELKNIGSAGCTACLVFTLGKHLICANAGDSKAVLYNSISDGCIELAQVHKPSDPSEMSRIQAAGGKVVWDGPCARVNNILATSRGIGDIYLKSIIIPDPAIFSKEISNGDDFVIIATDGLWDVFSPKEACLLALQAGDARTAAMTLADAAMQKGSSDNISVTVVDTRTIYLFQQQKQPAPFIPREDTFKQEESVVQKPAEPPQAISAQAVERPLEMFSEHAAPKTPRTPRSQKGSKSEKSTCTCM